MQEEGDTKVSRKAVVSMVGVRVAEKGRDAASRPLSVKTGCLVRMLCNDCGKGDSTPFTSPNADSLIFVAGKECAERF